MWALTKREVLTQQQKPQSCSEIALSVNLTGAFRERNMLYSFFPHFLKLCFSMLLRSQNISTFYTLPPKARVENASGHSNLSLINTESASRMISSQYKDVIYASALLLCTSKHAVLSCAFTQAVIYTKFSVFILITQA